MKLIALFFSLCSIASVADVQAQNKPASYTVYYELKLKSENFGDMGTRKMWINGDKMRWEATTTNLPLVLIKNQDGVFLVHPWNKMAAKYPADSDRGNPKTLFSGPTGAIDIFLKAVNAKKHGTETVSGQACDVYDYADKFSGRPCKIWVNPKTKKPVKLVLQGEKDKADTITATYVRFEPGAKVDDSLFQIPSDYAVKPMPKSTLASKKTDATKPG